MKQGITVAGNIIVDQLYAIHKYPAEGELSQIEQMVTRSTGGALCNVIMDLAKMMPGLPLQAIGKIGHDTNGKYVMDALHQYDQIDTDAISYQDTTGYTLVMNNQNSKERTFFSYMGSNKFLNEIDLRPSIVHARIFHIGYISLLKTLDQLDENDETVLSRVLKRIQEAGIKTSIDVISDSAQAYKFLVRSALKHTNYCIINELEAQGVTGIELRDKKGQLHLENYATALRDLKSAGVKDWVVIHCPEVSFGIDENNHIVKVNVDLLSKSQIVDNVGAGDAFCAGVLLSAYCEKKLETAIEIGNLAARFSLQAIGAVSGLDRLENMVKDC